jgi:2-furoyl-CoA dehydrogenase large subunit
MTELTRDSVRVSADPAAVWAVIDDPTALARVLPGAESLEPVGPGRWRGVLASKIGFMTVRADVTASLHDADPPRHLRLELEGRPRGLAGSFRASIPFDMTALKTGGTEIAYVVDMTVTGRLAAFGAPLLRDTLRRQVVELVRNLERELSSG